MANLGRHWKEEEISAVKDALNADEIDYPSFVSSVFSSFQSQLGVSETALALPAAVVGGVLAVITAVGAIVSIPAVLSVIDTAIDIDDWYENYKEKWQNDPDNADWYTEDVKRKNNIRLGDALTFGSSAGEFIERNSDGSYDFYSLLKPEFLNKHFGRALNCHKSIPENIVYSEDNDAFDFSRLSYFEDFNLNRLLGRALNYQVSEKHRVVERFPTSEENQSEQYDFKKMWKYHAINNEDFKLYLTSELKSISSYFNVSENNFVNEF